jgi:hypothetical protein
VEGIDVLYSTNTFFIESQAVLDALFYPGPRISHLILPERLATITSLELTWDLVLFGRVPNLEPDHQRDFNPDHRRRVDREKMATHLRCIGDVCPNLNSLVLSFTEPLYSDGKVQPRLVLDEIDLVLLRPLAEAVVRLPRPQKRPVVVELPYNVFVDVCSAGYNQLLGLQPPIDKKYDGVWLQYPLPPRGDLVASSDKPSPNVSSAPDLRCRYDTDVDQYSYYFIKEGVDTNLFWNYEGIANLRSHMMADGNIIM